MSDGLVLTITSSWMVEAVLARSLVPFWLAARTTPSRGWLKLEPTNWSPREKMVVVSEEATRRGFKPGLDFIKEKITLSSVGATAAA